MTLFAYRQSSETEGRTVVDCHTFICKEGSLRLEAVYEQGDEMAFADLWAIVHPLDALDEREALLMQRHSISGIEDVTSFLNFVLNKISSKRDGERTSELLPLLIYDLNSFAGMALEASADGSPELAMDFTVREFPDLAHRMFGPGFIDGLDSEDDNNQFND